MEDRRGLSLCRQSCHSSTRANSDLAVFAVAGASSLVRKQRECRRSHQYAADRRLTTKANRCGTLRLLGLVEFCSRYIKPLTTVKVTSELTDFNHKTNQTGLDDCGSQRHIDRRGGTTMR